MITLIVLCIVGYLLIIFGFCLWEALIGMNVDWDNGEFPLALAAILWPIAIPIILVYNFTLLVSYLKDSREEKERQKERNKQKQKAYQEKLRIAAEKEEQIIMEQVEKELRGSKL